MKVRTRLTLLALAVPFAGALAATALARYAEHEAKKEVLDRGRYLVSIGGCNDCHTPGYMQTAGATPEDHWLTGDRIGWQGPWGTSFAPNLRLFVRTIDEDGFVAMARERVFRPPMPTPTLRALTEPDLRAVYRYVQALGPAGDPAPAWVPLGDRVLAPVIVFPGTEE